MGGMKHGSGRWTSNKESYVGEWKGNKPEGLGVIVTEVSRYEGEVSMGMKHGSGSEVYNNGDRYTGGYVNGRQEGVGEYTWRENRAGYKGYFKNGLRHGVGVWTQGKDRYEGHYQNDKKNGKGTFTWASGNRYTGMYFDDMRHGYGEMTWADGSVYKGEWKYGVQNGLGELIEKGKPGKRGIFENNVLVCEEDLSKQLKMERIMKKSENFRTKNLTQFDIKVTGPIVEENDFFKKVKSFQTKKLAPVHALNRTMPRINRYKEFDS